jgi:hypothetical protein
MIDGMGIKREQINQHNAKHPVPKEGIDGDDDT